LRAAEFVGQTTAVFLNRKLLQKELVQSRVCVREFCSSWRACSIPERQFKLPRSIPARRRPDQRQTDANCAAEVDCPSSPLPEQSQRQWRLNSKKIAVSPSQPLLLQRPAAAIILR